MRGGTVVCMSTSGWCWLTSVVYIAQCVGSGLYTLRKKLGSTVQSRAVCAHIHVVLSAEREKRERECVSVYVCVCVHAMVNSE